jgi:hypothetical protein
VPYRIMKREAWKPGQMVGLFDQRVPSPGIPLDVHDGKVSVSPMDQHAMIVGSSGRGKTRRAIYPSVILSARAGHSMIIVDPKGEIYRHTATEVRKCGLNVKVLNLREPGCGDRWSPFTLVQQCWNVGNRSRATMLIKDIAEIVTSDIASERDRYWKMAAMDTIVGFALFLLERGTELTFSNIHHLVNQYFSERDLRDTFRGILDHSSDSYRRLTTLTGLDTEVTLSCVVSETNSALARYCDQADVRDLLLGSDSDMTEIGRTPTAYYIVVPDESTAMHPIAGLFISQSYSELIRYADIREENTLPLRVDYVIDEFGSIPGDDWCSKLTAARSRGIRFTLALQTLDQLYARYGEHAAKTILSNCRTVEYMGGRDFKIMRMMEDLSGKRVDQNGYEHPRLSMEQMSGMEMGQVIILDDSGKPRRGNLPDWSAWGITARADLSSTKREIQPEKPISIEDYISDPVSDSSGGNGIDVSRLSPQEKTELLMQLCPPPTAEEQALLNRLFPPAEPDDGGEDPIVPTDSDTDEFPF